MKKGELKKTDLNEIRECVECKQRKIITDFVKGKANLYRYLCKDCKNAARRTGKISETRFKKGGHPGKEFQKGHIPWYKQRGLPPPSKGTGTSESKNSAKVRDWCNRVKERDGWKCVKCGSTNKLAAHHIKPWKDDETLRFNVDNGISLCCSCHGREEGFQKGHVTILSQESRKKIGDATRGRKLSPEHIEKLKQAKKGYPGPMTGKKMSDESKMKMRLAKLGKPSNRRKKVNLS